MPKRKRVETPATKLRSPLYCACWIGKHCVVAGGGGKSSSGIPNRVWSLKQAGRQLAETSAVLDVEDAPLRLATAGDPGCVLLALISGALIRVCLDVSSPKADARLSVGELPEGLRSLSRVKCLCLSKNGRLLAAACEDGTLSILDWPSGAVKKTIRSSAVRDMDFSSAHGNKVLGTTYEDGSCVLWEWGSETQLLALVLPPELRRGSFNRIRFAPDASPQLYTVANVGSTGHVLLWRQDEHGEVRLHKQCRAHSTAITAFDVSPSGAYFGTGTSEGEIAVFATRTMTAIRRVAKGHMVFTTAVSFSPEERSLLSVSADASARITLLADAPAALATFWLAAAVAAIVAVCLAWLARARLS